MNETAGMLICAAGGLAGAVFALPFRKIKGVAYESYWLVYALFGLVVFPITLGFVTVPGFTNVIANTPIATLLACAGFGALWGIGGLTWGLMIRYLGVGLGLAIGCGLCSATGTLIPPIVRGEIGDLVKDTAAIVTLVSVVVSLVGIVFVGMAGKFKESELSEEEKKKAVAEFDFKKGMLVALISGVFSGCINFGLQWGGGIAIENGKEVVLESGLKKLWGMSLLAREAGASELWTGIPVLVVVLLGGFVVQVVYCFSMNAKNKTFGDYAKFVKLPGISAVALSALAGIIWASQFVCQKTGEPAMGSMGYISFAILMGSSVLFSSLLGVILGEWKGTGAKTRKMLALGLFTLAASIAIAVVAKKL